MDNTRFQKKRDKILKKNENLEKKRELAELRNKYKKKYKLPSTSKIVLFYMFVMCTGIVIYSLIAMWHFQDLSYLGTLLGSLGLETLTTLGYYAKSTKENTVGGISYDLTMSQYKQTDSDNILG